MEQELLVPTEIRNYNIFRRLYTNIIARLFLVLAIIVTICAYLTFSSTQAHSESDVKYRQQGFIISQEYQRVKETSDDQSTNDSFFRKVQVSYEVDFVTPTPTPIIVSSNDDVWLKLAQCESKQNWSINTGNGYYGGLQFNLGAWASVGGSGKPSDASKEEQIMRGQMLQQRRGWAPWGACSKKLGLL